MKGAVVKLGKEFSYCKIIGTNILEVGAATLDRKVANFAKDNNLGNLEFLSLYTRIYWRWNNNEQWLL